MGSHKKSVWPGTKRFLKYYRNFFLTFFYSNRLFHFATRINL